MHNDNKKSKFLNNPVRTIVIEDDNRPGSYPAHIPPGSTLVDPIYFDDTDTIETPTDRSFANSDTFKVSSQVDQLNEVEILFTNASLFEQHRIKFSDKTTGNISGEGTIIGGTRTYFISKPSDIFRGDSLTTTQFATRTNEAIVAKINDIGLLTANIDSAGFIKATCRSPGAVGNSTQIDVQSPYFTNFSVAFSGGAGGTYRLPFGIPSAYLDAGSEVALRAVASSSYLDLGIDVFGPGDSRLLEVYSKGHPVYKGPNSIAPYNETNSIQSFGLGSRPNNSGYGTDPSQNSEFFLRGSTSGSLDESLANKDKIVIDLTPVEPTTIRHITDGSGDGNYHMMYFNHVDKKWERLGFGVSHDADAGGSATLTEFLDSCYIGFSAMQRVLNTKDDRSGVATYLLDPTDYGRSILPSNFEEILSDPSLDAGRYYHQNWGSTVDTFGFPHHAKFHATGSQTLDVSSLVDRPFLVEKMVYEFSGSTTSPAEVVGNDYSFGDERGFAASGGVFFILNQRNSNPDPSVEGAYTNLYGLAPSPFSGATFKPPPILDGDPITGGQRSEIIHYNSPIPQSRVLSPGADPTYVDSTRDLLTFSRVTSIPTSYQTDIVDTLLPGTPHPAEFADLVIEVPDLGTFDRKLTLAADIVSPTSSPSNTNLITNNFGEFTSPTGWVNLYYAKDSSTRNSIDVPTGRARLAEFSAARAVYRTNQGGGYVYEYILDKDSYDSPYLIMPGDKLVFGWQSMTRFVFGPASKNWGPDFTISTGAGKLILYGSYLQDDKPVHDIYKDQLSSDAAHEAIPAGPWVLDRFESEPSMVYTGSMRAQLVTGTMVTQGSGGSLSVTDRDDLSLGGVRAVAATSYDGNLGQRGSFYRNLRLVDSEEQYYDSMQPNALDALSVLSNGNELRVSDIGLGSRNIYIRIPGEIYFFAGLPAYSNLVTDYSNDTLIGSYPFEPKFSGINREKFINTRNISQRRFLTYNAVALQTTTEVPEFIAFVTGTTAGGGIGNSNLEQAGGLFKNRVTLGFGAGVPVTHQDDTNPIKPTPFESGQFAGILQSDQTYAGNIPFLQVNYHLSRFMGCFGDGYLGLVQYEKFRTTSNCGKQIYRGARYGLINPTPLFSTAIYNGTSFGQPRDLMEPRKYSRFSLADNTLTDSAVDVVFVDNTVVELADGARNNVTSGSATNSINISPFCTSSLPFVDGQVNDRSLPLPEDLLRL